MFDILDFFIIWSCLVFRSRILVLCGRGGIFGGEGMGSLKIISFVLLCRSSSDIPVFLSPRTPKKLKVFLSLGPTSTNRRNSSCNNVLEIF